MKRTILTTAAATAALTLLAACGGGSAGGDEGGEFTPEGDVTMLVPFAAGGGSDLAGRATPRYAAYLGALDAALSSPSAP